MYTDHVDAVPSALRLRFRCVGQTPIDDQLRSERIDAGAPPGNAGLCRLLHPAQQYLVVRFQVPEPLGRVGIPGRSRHVTGWRLTEMSALTAIAAEAHAGSSVKTC